MAERKKTMTRRELFTAVATTALGVGIGTTFLNRWQSGSEQPVSGEEVQRRADIQVFRDKIFELIYQDENKEAFALLYSDDFLNQKLQPTPEEPNPQRFYANRGKTKIYDSFSYTVRTSPFENSEQRKQIPAITYAKDAFEGKDALERFSGILDNDNKFTGQIVRGEDPKTEEEEQFEAEELKTRLKKIFKFSPEQWGQFEWESRFNSMTNTAGIPRFGIEGNWEDDEIMYTTMLWKSGAVSLRIDHRAKTFGTTQL